jgi:outer membrane protein assembly factor BamE (lipoprotein component of BamABCDE complex)
MKKILFASLLAASFTAAGCASTGNTSIKDETRSSVQEKLKKGMTQEQVVSLFGDPLSTGFSDNGTERWRYSFTESQMKASSFIPYVSLFNSGSKGTSRNLVILFGDAGLVDKFTMSASDVDTSSGFMG